MAKKPKGESVTSVTFYVDKGFEKYLPQLQQHANTNGLELGPAARDLVKQALDALSSGAFPPPATSPSNGDGILSELRSLQQMVRGSEMAIARVLLENRKDVDSQLKATRDELAQVLRLAFRCVQGLKDEQIDDLVVSVFKR